MTETSSDLRLLLTVNEAARSLGIARSHLYSLVMRGDIPSVKLGRSRRIPVAALERFIAERLEEEDTEGASASTIGLA